MSKKKQKNANISFSCLFYQLNLVTSQHEFFVRIYSYGYL